MKNKITLLESAVILLAMLALVVIFLRNNIGITRSFIEKDARKSHAIKDDWQVAKDTTDAMSAMVFYSEDKSKHVYSIYINHPGLSLGYHFRMGGSGGSIEHSVVEISITDNRDRAFLSLNKQQVCKIEIDNGIENKTIEVDSEKPFAYIIPRNSGAVTFYDIDGNIINPIS